MTPQSNLSADTGALSPLRFDDWDRPLLFVAEESGAGERAAAAARASG
jgi:hypothetical protein